MKIWMGISSTTGKAPATPPAVSAGMSGEANPTHSSQRAEIYNWFTEGHDTPDLQDARELLRELSSTNMYAGAISE